MYYFNDPNNENQLSGKTARNALKGTIKRAAFKKILKSLAPYLTPLIPIAAAFLIVMLIVLGVYGAISSVADLDGNSVVDQRDEEKRKEYEKWADYYSGEPISEGQLELNHRIPWGLLYSLDLYEAEVNRKPFEVKAKEAAERLAPRFEYRTSTVRVVTKKKVTYTDKNGNKRSKWVTTVEEYEVKLLVKADTYMGIYEYEYERRTETREGKDFKQTITKDHLVNVNYTEDWTRLENEMKLRNIPVSKMDRDMVVELGDGVTETRLAIDWMIGFDIYDIVGAFIGEIPPELLEWFKEAGRKYGVPWYILAAIADVETGGKFNADAVGKPNWTGELAQGLMQFLPSTWAKYGVDADGDGVKNPFSPKDAIFGAANYLSALLKQYNGDMEKAIFGYNRSEKYVKAVLAKAQAYKNQAEMGGKGYLFPVLTDNWRFSSYFGYRGNEFHHGLDIAAPYGTPIVSVVAGKVLRVGYDPDGYGNYVEVLGVDGKRYIYAHMSKFGKNIKTGVEVRQGTVLGRVGSTGRSTGNHLHFGVKDEFGNWMDPLLLFR